MISWKEIPQVVKTAVHAGLFLLAFEGATRVHAEEARAPSIAFCQVAPGPTQGFRPLTLLVAKEGSPKEAEKETLYVSQTPDLTVLDLDGAEGRLDKNGRPTLVLHFTPTGREKFKAITKERSAGGHSSREAILLDGILVSAPTIKYEIDSPTAMVTAASGLERLISAFLDNLPADKRGAK